MEHQNFTENQENQEMRRIDFEAQFSRREHFEVAGGIAEVVDVTPEKIKDEVPVFLAPGWGCNVDVYRAAIKTLVNEERRVVSLSHPRTGGDLEAHTSEEAIEKYPTEQLRKALNIIGVMDAKNIEKTDVIAHSEAALNTTIAAMLYPDRFRNIVFFAPAGLIGEDRFSRLTKGFAGQTKRPESLADMPITKTEKEVGQLSLKSVIDYLSKNPLRAVKETLEISKSDIHDMIRYLHEKGIGIVIMSAIDDPVFPTYQMQKVAKVDMIDGFLSMKGGHGTIFERPEEYIPWADKMLTALENQRKNTVDGHKPDLQEEFI